MEHCITETTINAAFFNELNRINKIYPTEKWHQVPSHVELTDSKTVYGYATPEGIMKINRLFCGSQSYNKLLYTIAHEFAHYAVGLHHKHDKLFRRYEHAFQAALTEPTKQEISFLLDSVQFKYTLYAITEPGNKLEIKQADKKTKRYTHYDPKSRWVVDNEYIQRFEFVENR